MSSSTDESTAAGTLGMFIGVTRIFDSARCFYPEKDPDAPTEVVYNPYKKEDRKCLLCRTGVELDYKNARLLQVFQGCSRLLPSFRSLFLQQFVSTFSGRVYDRHITGLCDHQQKRLVETISLSRKAGYMPIFVKDPKYTRDPKLFDPLRPIRPHSFAWGIIQIVVFMHVMLMSMLYLVINVFDFLYFFTNTFAVSTFLAICCSLVPSIVFNGQLYTRRRFEWETGRIPQQDRGTTMPNWLSRPRRTKMSPTW